MSNWKGGLPSDKKYIGEIHSPSMFFKLIISKEQTVNIGLIYRSPSSTDKQNEMLNKQIEQACAIFKSKKEDLVILGDFNFPEIDWERETSSRSDNHISSKFLKTTNENYLFQIVDKPTHLRGTQTPTLFWTPWLRPPVNRNCFGKTS